jgi:hypothetical protein
MVTYGYYPSIPHALRFTKGGKGLIYAPLCTGGMGLMPQPVVALYVKQLLTQKPEDGTINWPKHVA